MNNGASYLPKTRCASKTGREKKIEQAHLKTQLSNRKIIKHGYALGENNQAIKLAAKKNRAKM